MAPKATKKDVVKKETVKKETVKKEIVKKETRRSGSEQLLEEILNVADKKMLPFELEEGGEEAAAVKKKPRKQKAAAEPLAIEEHGKKSSPHTSSGLPELSGFLPTSAARQKTEFPLKIPSNYYEGRLPLPLTMPPTVTKVKVEAAKEASAAALLSVPVAYSDSKAVCRHAVESQVHDQSSAVHSLSPAMMSGLIHFFEFTVPDEKLKKKPTQSQACADPATTALMSLDHDKDVLERKRDGWSFWGRGKHHIVVNLMDQKTDEKKARRRSSQRSRR